MKVDLGLTLAQRRQRRFLPHQATDYIRPLLTAPVKRAIRRFGYELQRIKILRNDHVPSELKGLTFRDFLECYIGALNGPDFFFVQVGAHDGISYGDILRDFVIRYKLSGLLIEPQAKVFKELQENYRQQSGLFFENAAIGHTNGWQQLYTIKSNLEFLAVVNGAASFNLEHVRKLLVTYLHDHAPREVIQRVRELGLSVDDCIEAETVETYTFEAVLNKYGVRRIDLLQIDTEGFDYEVIKMAILARHHPILINYEHEHLMDRDRLACWEVLRALDYRMFTHGGDTCAYKRPPR